MKSLAVGTLFALTPLLPTPLTAQDQPGSKPGPEAEPVPAHYQTHHSIVLEGETVEYDATVGSIILRNAEEKPIAEVFYTAYFRSGVRDPSRRPLIFAYNGGPGSSSFWLHMGVMGPRRVVVPGDEPLPPPPYEVVENEYTLLDRADIVMLDPVGTGFSHPLGEAEGKDFWGVDEDARSLAQFIQRFLSEYGRWNSPRYLLGESYGTTRSAVLARALQDRNIDLNGIVLVSAVLDFRTILFSPGDDVPYIVNLPSYAATAWYHRVLPERPPELAPFLAEVERFAVNDYARALLAGSTLDPEERARILDQMHRYTGLSQDFLERADLRVTAPEFEQELLRSKGLSVGRLDARFTGAAGDLLAQTPEQDPQSSAISGAFTAAWNHYLRTELGYDGDREYVPSGNVNPWNWQHGEGIGFGLAGVPNVGPDLAEALRRNPHLEVLLVTGLYDLATPYFAASWTMDHLGLPPHLRDNIRRVDFEAGHMMYIHEGALPGWRDALLAFLDRTSGGR